MIVCSCNLLTDADIRAALAKPRPPERVRDVYAACGCAAKCGGCAGSINRLIQETRTAGPDRERIAAQRDAA